MNAENHTGVSYFPVSLANQGVIVALSTTAMRTIADLDECSEELSKILEEKIQAIQDKGDQATDAERSEVEVMFRLLEVIATEKISLAVNNYDYIDHSLKAVDMEINMIEGALRRSGVQVPVIDNVDNDDSKKRKRPNDDQSTTTSVSSSEPVYCTCKRVAFGDMIACDNEDCPIEWFHYGCVNLTRKPRNAWVCPLCSNKRKK